MNSIDAYTPDDPDVAQFGGDLSLGRKWNSRLGQFDTDAVGVSEDRLGEPGERMATANLVKGVSGWVVENVQASQSRH